MKRDMCDSKVYTEAKWYKMHIKGNHENRTFESLIHEGQGGVWSCESDHQAGCSVTVA